MLTPMTKVYGRKTVFGSDTVKPRPSTATAAGVCDRLTVETADPTLAERCTTAWACAARSFGSLRISQASAIRRNVTSSPHCLDDVPSRGIGTLHESRRGQRFEQRQALQSSPPSCCYRRSRNQCRIRTQPREEPLRDYRASAWKHADRLNFVSRSGTRYRVRFVLWA